VNIDSAQASQLTESQPTDATSQTEDQPVSSKSDEPSAFSKLLSKGGAGKPDGESKAAAAQAARLGAHAGTDGVPGINNVVTAIPADVQPAITTASPVQAPHSVAIPPGIEGVVREITTGINGAGNHEVHIELTSKTLGGLKIQLERHDGKIDIQFQSRTDDVARLLSRNVNELSQALADRGVQVNEIRVETPQSAARAEEYRPRSRQNDPGSGGQGRGGGQDRQQGRQ
jgi:flagellar hook-length control protein FliK